MASTYVMQVFLGDLGWLCQARLKVHPTELPPLPKPGGSCQGKEQKETSRVKCPFAGVPPKPWQQAAIDPAMLSTSSLSQLGGFCFALCVKLFVQHGTSLPAPWLRFPIWAERLLCVYSRSGLRWRQVHSSTLKFSDEKRWRRTEAY